MPKKLIVSEGGNKAPSSQGYGFSSSQVQMWELDYKESWAPKNWCFWTVVLKKTVESPLDCKEIQPVHPKGDQSWVFIGRTDVEAEIPILWPPDAKSWLIWKDPDAGRDWGQEEKGTTEDEMVGWYHRLNGHGFGWTPEVGDEQGGLVCCGSWGHRVRHDWVTELNWITLQYCGGFCHTFTWVSHGCTCFPHPDPTSHLPPHPIPQGHPSAPALSTLSHCIEPGLVIYFHMVIYMFQCYSLKSSHPCLLLQSLKVCSLHLCLFCHLAYRVIIIIFLNSIYMR